MSPYSFCVMAGLIVCVLLVYFYAEGHKLSGYKMLLLHTVPLIGLFIGMHVLYALTQPQKLVKLFADIGSYPSFKDFLMRFGEVFGGAVFYGGLLGGLLTAAIVYKKQKLTPEYADVGACAIPLFHFFGRIGCFLTGCCYGVECSFGFVYKYAVDSAANGVRRFPVQLLEAGFNLFLFFLLFSLLKKGRLRGRLLRLYLLLYPAFRFADEFLRGDVIRGRLWIFSTSQWISLIILVCVITYSLITRNRGKNRGEQTAAAGSDNIIA